ncbi:hypothetical protein LPJ81_003162, partial [Coemansia sp. IMI 209127]
RCKTLEGQSAEAPAFPRRLQRRESPTSSLQQWARAAFSITEAALRLKASATSNARMEYTQWAATTVEPASATAATLTARTLVPMVAMATTPAAAVLFRLRSGQCPRFLFFQHLLRLLLLPRFS